MKIDGVFFKYWKKINKYDLLLLCVFCFVGILSNISLLVNQVTNPDGILAGEYMQSFSWDVATGRWATAFIYGLRGAITLPALTTLVSIFLFSISTLLILKMLKIQSWLLRGLVGSALMSFPTLTQYLTYYYMSDTFSVSMLLAVLSVFIANKSFAQRKIFWKVALAIALLVLSMSIYQSLVGVAVFVCLGIIILDTKDEKNSNKYLLKKIIYFLGYGILSAAFYFAISKLVCSLTGIPMADYRGINTAMWVDFSNLPNLVSGLFSAFFKFYFTDQYYAYTHWFLNVAFGLILLLWALVEVGTCVNYLNTVGVKRVGARAFLRLILFALLPIAATAIGLIATNTSIDFKMLPQMMLPIALAVACIENVPMLNGDNNFKIQGMIALAIVFIVARDIAISNGIGEAMKLKADAARSLSTRVLVRLEENDQYSAETPIAILGNCEDEYWLSANSAYFEKVRSDTALWGQFWSSESNLTQASWYQYFRKYHGVSLYMVDQETATLISETTEFQSMPVFPKEGSIQIINNVLTIKLSDFQ